LARNSLLRIILLVAFGVSHLPGYGLHAIVSDEKSEVKACCGGCAFDRGINKESEESSSEDEESSYPCSVCRLLAEVFVADIAIAEVTSYPFEVECDQLCESADASRFPPTPPSRGPPELS